LFLLPGDAKIKLDSKDQRRDQVQKIRVLIVDDHALFRETLHQLLDREEDMLVVGEAQDNREAEEKVTALAPDVIVMDLKIHQSDSLETVRSLVSRHPEIGIVILSVYQEPENILAAARAGARGYVLKNSRSKVLMDTIRAVRRGENCLLEGLLSLPDGRPPAASHGGPAPYC